MLAPLLAAQDRQDFAPGKLSKVTDHASEHAPHPYSRFCGLLRSDGLIGGVESAMLQMLPERTALLLFLPVS